MIKVRNDEQHYAFLRDEEAKDRNCHGNSINLANPGDELTKDKLEINGEPSSSDNPNRYKQHGFYLNADNCIGCHACEAACSEKNDNPAHIAFRSVGFVEGGTYPDYQRINISMACNHCDDPVCLKGCPTRAYTKFAEYGAVLQDPDICFGCGYCTWVCPYNAPQLDPVKGQVSKCNMCVDRLEVGLKPSCVSACLGNALDFGVIENVPENRELAQTEIPGFPTTDITQPNIRFQQTKGAHQEMTRTDSMPVKYYRNADSDKFESVVDEKSGHKKQWNLKSLLTSHESAHVIFTLLTQASVGAFLIMILGPRLLAESMLGLASSNLMISLTAVIFIICTVGLYKLNMHLGKPHRFYRGFNNLRLSPVSREIAGVSLFYTGLLGYLITLFLPFSLITFIGYLFAGLAVLTGPVGLYYMYKLYRIPARPFWNHLQTGTAFAGTMLSFGALIITIVSIIVADTQALETMALIKTLASIMTLGLLIEGIGHLLHARDMKKLGNEGAASFYRQVTQYGYSYLLRNSLLTLNIILALYFAMTGVNSLLNQCLFAVFAVSMLLMFVFGRSLFFVLVIPTTMPGAFFWKNEGFVEHARETGLADMQQVGVVYERHHAFKLDELLKTIKENSWEDIRNHIKWILGDK